VSVAEQVPPHSHFSPSATGAFGDGLSAYQQLQPTGLHKPRPFSYCIP